MQHLKSQILGGLDAELFVLYQDEFLMYYIIMNYYSRKDEVWDVKNFPKPLEIHCNI